MPRATRRLGHFTMHGDPHSVRAALVEVRAALDRQGVRGSDLDNAQIVLAETLNNIAEHGRRADDPAPEVDVRLWRRGPVLLIHVADNGDGLPASGPPEGAMPALDGPRHDLPEGGFGWGLIRILTTRAVYRSGQGRNSLLVRLPLGARD